MHLTFDFPSFSAWNKLITSDVFWLALSALLIAWARRLWKK